MGDFLLVLRESVAYVCELELHEVGPDATLESLGIDSLLASQILVETEVRSGFEFDVAVLEELDETITVREVAEAFAGLAT